MARHGLDWGLVVGVVLLSGCYRSSTTLDIKNRWHLAPRREARQQDLLVGKEISFKVRADFAGREFVIRSKANWAKVWMALGKPVPEVDFTKHMVVGVCRAITGRTLDFRVDRIERRAGGCVVYVKELILPPGLIFTIENVYRGEEADYVVVEKLKVPFLFVDDPVWRPSKAHIEAIESSGIDYNAPSISSKSGAPPK